MRETNDTVQTVRIIWFGLLMSIVIYAAVAFVVVEGPAATPLEDAFSDPIVLALHGAGLAVFAMSFVVSAAMLKGTSSANAQAHRAAPQPPPAPGVVRVTPRMRSALIARWAMTEATAVFGLVAAFLKSDPRLFLPLGALAIAGMLLAYPSDDRIRSIDEAAL
jgi:amino acid transporter